jgi:Lrp/AsnC family leucine-responsive transcriptional regulator
MNSSDDAKRLLDAIGWRILRELQQNARLPFAELGRRVGLSTPAAIERVRRMEEAGIIEGYRTEINLATTGFPILAFVRITVIGDYIQRTIKVANEVPEVLECHRVTGSDSFILKVCVASIDHLQLVIDRFTPYVGTTTSIVLSSAIKNRVLDALLAPSGAHRKSA